jgi:FAD/FMN-containing dehydrogenase
MKKSQTPAVKIHKIPTKNQIARRTRRGFLLGLGAGIFGAVGWQRGTSSPVALLSNAQATGSLTLNDASEMSETPIWDFLELTLDSDTSRREVSSALHTARDFGHSVQASAARHSMGGQSIPRDGMVLSMNEDSVQIDQERQTYKVAGGTRWHHVITRLDAIGFSPAVMQSNNDFGVASTYCVNAHGWPVPYSGCGSTVRSLKMHLSNAEEIVCSRTQNPEIFGAAMGGYGLIGIITELELDMVPNQRLLPTYEVMPSEEFGTRFQQAITSDPEISMAYGRLDVSHDRFFDEALMITYTPDKDQSALPPATGSGIVSKAAARLFRAQVENERIKGLRWWIERDLGPRIAAGPVTRNALLNEPVVTLDDGDPTRTDILHEYFISPERLPEFLRVCREVIPNSYQQLLNVTLRYVAADTESMLAYAPQARIAAVMLFSQEKAERAEADMTRMTRQLIDGALAAGGSYYLPYRLHATQEQFEAAYPRAREFAAFKRSLDPRDRFSNALWTTYLKDLT